VLFDLDQFRDVLLAAYFLLVRLRMGRFLTLDSQF
jgi:hypothetical protein